MIFSDRLKLSNRRGSLVKKKRSDISVCGMRLFFSTILVFVFLLCSTKISKATGLVDDPYVTNGTVYAIAENDSTLYLGGDFTVISQKTGSMVDLNATDAARNTDFPEIIGSVSVIISDGLQPNGWYIAGEFTRVGGNAIYNIAHINADGTVDTGFNPTGGYLLDGAIHSMVLDGDFLYIGGDFENFLGFGLTGLVAINTAVQGISSTWDPAPSGGSVKTAIYAMAVSGTTLYVAGDFTSIGGQNRAGLAAINTLDSDDDTGRADAGWNPDPQVGYVNTLFVSGSNLYVGGTFANIGGQIRSRVAALETVGTGDGTGRANTTWDPGVTGNSVDSLLLSGTSLYVGGDFTGIGGQSRNNLAAVNAVGAGDGTGRADAVWNPDVHSTALPTMAIDETNHRLFIGGEIAQVGGQSRDHIAVIDAVGGGDGTGEVLLPWDAHANLPVQAVVLSDDRSRLYAGGRFNSLVTAAEFISRNRIAAIAKSDGVPTTWNPNANDRVRALVLSGNILYAGGSFTEIGGQPRERIAALDTSQDTNNATPWNPGADGRLHTLLLEGNTLYVGGAFTQIGGNARNRIAALNSATGDVLSFDPNADDDVYAVLLNNGTLYVGGAFAQIGGSARNRIAALDSSTGEPLSFDPNVSITSGQSAVYALALNEAILYVGGSFDTIASTSRNNIAAVDTATEEGSVTSWDPNIDSTVYTMIRSGSSLYVGGAFQFTGGDGVNDDTDVGGVDAGVYHLGVAVLDIARDVSIARTWSPALYNGSSTAVVYAMSLSGDASGRTFYIGGDFGRGGTYVLGNWARFDFIPPTTSVNVPTGTYPKEQFAAISCEPADGFECDSAYYTLDGSEPTGFSTPAIWGGAYIERDATLKYFVLDNAGMASAVGTETYTIKFENVICFVDTVGHKNILSHAIDDFKNWIKQMHE